MIDKREEIILETSIQESFNTVKHFLGKVVNAPLEEIGGILKDNISYWRFTNRINLIQKAKKYIEEKGIDPASIPLNIFVPLIEDGGNTDDEMLSDMFASLLSAHLDPNTQNTVHPSYSKVLAQLAPLDAQVLNEMYIFKERPTFYKPPRSLPDTPTEIIKLTYQNLFRLGLCEWYEHKFDYEMMRTGDLGIPRVVTITTFGKSFMDACTKIQIIETE